MSGAAILMMILAMLLLWGGLVLAIINLARGDRSGRRAAPGARGQVRRDL